MVDIVPCIILAIILLAKNNNKTILGIAILVFAVVTNFLPAIFFKSSFSIYAIIAIINEVLLAVALLVDWKKYKINISKYSWIFIVLPIIHFALIFIGNFDSWLKVFEVYWWAIGDGDWWRSLFDAILMSITLNMLSYVGWHVFLGKYVCYKPKKKSKVNTNHDHCDGNKYNNNVNGYISMGKHIVLCVFTFGIWYLIWIYRTTAFLNKAPDSEEYSPTSKLLLCMFVPFYIIFWTYEHGKRIDRLAKENKVSSDIATVSLILGIFIPIVACIIMQDKINSISTAIARKSRLMTKKKTESLEQQKTATRSAVNETTNSNADGCDIEPPDTDSYDAEISDIEECNSEVSNDDVLSAPSEKTASNPYSEIKQLKELLDMGIITQEEFNTKKKQLLSL